MLAGIVTYNYPPEFYERYRAKAEQFVCGVRMPAPALQVDWHEKFGPELFAQTFGGPPGAFEQT